MNMLKIVNSFFLFIFLMSCSTELPTVYESRRDLSLLMHQVDSLRQVSQQIYDQIEQIKNARSVDTVVIGTDLYISVSRAQRRQIDSELKALRDSFAISNKKADAIEKEQELIKQRLDRIEREIERRKRP